MLNVSLEELEASLLFLSLQVTWFWIFLVHMPLGFFLHLWSLVTLTGHISRVTHRFSQGYNFPYELVYFSLFFWKFSWIISFFLIHHWPFAKILIMLIFPCIVHFHVSFYITSPFQLYFFNFTLIPCSSLFLCFCLCFQWCPLSCVIFSNMFFI